MANEFVFVAKFKFLLATSGTILLCYDVNGTSAQNVFAQQVLLFLRAELYLLRGSSIVSKKILLRNLEQKF